MTKITKKSEQQKGAEAEVEAFRKDLGPFVVAAQETRMPMVFTDAKVAGDPIVFVNDSFLRLSGYDREEVLGKSFHFLMANDIDRDEQAQIEAAFGDGPDDSLDARCRRKDGTILWAAVFIGPVRDEAGEIVQHFASFLDLSRHKREDEHLRFLLDELSHRTQNTLVTVQAIAAQTFRDLAASEVLETFQGRIMALAKVHSLLGRESWLAVGLHDVIDQVLQPFGFQRDGVGRFRVDGEEIRLPPKVALTLAMVFQELATNAAKYGALSAPGGKIGLAWTTGPTAAGDRIELHWRESGGPAVSKPGRRGFGLRLIEGGLAHELHGEVHLDFEPSGLDCRVVMPVPRTAAA